MFAYTQRRMGEPESDMPTPMAPPGDAGAVASVEAKPVAVSDAADAGAAGAAGPPGRRRWRRHRVLLAAGFVVVAVITCGLLIGLALTQEPPRWWGTVNTADPKTIATAEAVENGMATALTQIRPVAQAPAQGAKPTGAVPSTVMPNGPGEWKVFITNDQANAWLNVRLKKWLADQTAQGNIQFTWPEQVGELRVNFDGGLIAVGARVYTGLGGQAADAPNPADRGKAQTLAAELRPEFKPDGSLWMTAERINIGRLPVPASWVLGSGGQTREGRERIGEVSSELASLPQTDKVLKAFSGAGPVLTRPIIRLADGRRVRLVAIEPDDGKLVITCRTEAR